MQITDACVFPYPLGDSSVRRMALEARDLGFDSIVAVDAPPGDFSGITILSGTIIRDSPVKDVINRVKRARESDSIVIVQARDNGFNRAAISVKGVHMLCGIHTADKLAFDHVTAKMAADNRVAVDLDLSPLIAGRGVGRQRALHRYRDILMLSSKFGFPVTLSTHARSILDMRSVREISGLCSVLGMEISDVGNALSGVAKVTSPKSTAVTVIQ